MLGKPLSTVRDTPAIFSHVGVTLEALDLGLGQTVLDFGAGSCWLSAILNRLGARTISMDVSPTGLELGQEVFRSDPHARPELEPRFVAYDGHRIPLPDASVDRAVCFDSFHHVPNRDEVLGELYRVLRPGGRFVLAEPGEGHANAGHSRFDAEHYGVLESDLPLDDLLARARRAERSFFSFALPHDVAPGETVDLVALLHMPERAGRYRLVLDLVDQKLAWFEQCGSAVTEVELVAEWPDSRAPHRLRAQIDVLHGRPAGPLPPGSTLSMRLRIANTGDTRWLADPAVGTGEVKLGVQVRAVDGTLLQRDYFRALLPRALDPEESTEMAVPVPIPGERGRFVLALDMVAEQVCWFEHHGSPPLLIEIEAS